jgi:hypothetical protein
MKNTFILYVFDIIKLYIFSNMLVQTLPNLILTKLKMQSKKERGSTDDRFGISTSWSVRFHNQLKKQINSILTVQVSDLYSEFLIEYHLRPEILHVLKRAITF